MFTYRCGDLQWGIARIGFLGSNFPQVHRILVSGNATQQVACANYPNVWNNLVYHLTAGMYVHCYLPVSYCSLYTVKLKTLAHSVFLVNDLCISCYVELIQCVSEVDESRKTALLECSKNYDVKYVVCVLPSETIYCK